MTDAADLTQESFVKAFRSISKFKAEIFFFTWLYRIGVNMTLTHLQKRQKTVRSSLVSNIFLMKWFKQGIEFSSRNHFRPEHFLNELHEKLNEALIKVVRQT